MTTLKRWGRKAWKRFQAFGQVLGDFIGRLILTVFYFTVMLPLGIGVRLFSDPLDLRAGEGSAWRDHGPSDRALDEGRRQY